MSAKRLKKTGRLFVLVAVLILFTVGIFAQTAGPGFMGMGQRGMGMRGPGVTRLYFVLKANQAEFKISDAQMEKIKKVMFSFEEQMVNLRNEVNVQGLELKKLMMAEKKDYKKMKEVLSLTADVRSDILIAGFKARDEITNILTPEQQEALKASMKEKFRGRRFLQRGLRRPGTMRRGSLRERFPRFRDQAEE